MLKKGFGGSFKNNAKCKFVKPEDVVEGTEYSFTYNPEHQPSRKGIEVNGFKVWWQAQKTLIGSYAYCDIVLYPEISSLGRWHFHGTISIRDTIPFYHDTVPRMAFNASIEMDTIQDESIWDVYYSKQWQITMPFIFRELEPIIETYNDEIYKITT